MSSFFSFFYPKPKAEEVMATKSLTSEDIPPVKSTTEDSQSEPQSPVNLLSPPRRTQPQTPPAHSPSPQPDSTSKEQEISKNSTISEEHSYSDDEVLSYIAENNELSVSWSRVMRIIRERLEKTCQDSEIQIAINSEDFDKNENRKVDVENYKQTINQLLDNFEKPPFTIQRLSELILKPFQHHKTLIKWLRAVEKVLTVQSSLDAFPSISNTITLTDKLELMEVTTSPKLVPISFAYNAEEIEKENANSPKLVPIKFTYNAELEVADNEEEADDMNEDYYYDKEEIDMPEDDIDEIGEEKMQDIDKEESDMFESEYNAGKKKRDYNIEDNIIAENRENISSMIKKKKEDNVEDKMIGESGEDIFGDVEKDDDVDSLFEERNKIMEDKEKGRKNIGSKLVEDKNEKVREKQEKHGENIKDNMVEEKNKENVREITEGKGETIDENMIREKSVESVEESLDNKIEKVNEEIEENKKEKSQDKEKAKIKY